MFKNRRLYTALFLSLIGLALTQFLLKPKEWARPVNKNNQALAKIIFSSNSVKRQTEGRIIWETLKNGDVLYKGDRIKTSSESIAKIEFLETKAIVNMEPNSVVVISPINNKLSLRLLEGNLFVSNKNRDQGQELAIFSGENGVDKINVQNAEATVSVGDKGKASVSVISGQIDGQDGIQLFQELRPYYGEETYVDSGKNIFPTFKWNPIDNEKYSIKLEAGEDRNHLNVLESELVNSIKGESVVSNLVGTIYWRLIATDKKANKVFHSAVLKANFKKAYPPLPVYPVKNELVQISLDQKNVDFKWNLPHPLEAIEFVLSKNNLFKESILSEAVTHQTYYSTNLIKEPGHYFWQVKGRLPGSKILISTPPQEFDVVFGTELLSPVLQLPADKSTFYSSDEDTKREVLFSFNSVEKASQYQVTLKGPNDSKNKRVIKTSATEIPLTGLLPGNYSWWVQSLDETGKVSKVRDIRSFSWRSMGSFEINKNITKPNYFYVQELPKVDLAWFPFQGSQNYRLKISPNSFFNPAESFLSKTTSFKYQISNPGKLFMQVEALGENDVVLAKTTVFNLNILLMPLPEAPSFSPILSNPIAASLKGQFDFDFVKRSPEHSLLIEVRDANNIAVFTKNSILTSGVVSGLKPGAYYLWARSIDEFGRNGEWSDKRKVVVQNKSELAPPKMKGIKVR